MSPARKTFFQAPEQATCIGLQINIRKDNLKSFMQVCQHAKKWVEVRVICDGEVKDMTLKEFLRRLGFARKQALREILLLCHEIQIPAPNGEMCYLGKRRIGDNVKYFSFKGNHSSLVESSDIDSVVDRFIGLTGLD